MAIHRTLVRRIAQHANAHALLLYGDFDNHDLFIADDDPTSSRAVSLAVDLLLRIPDLCPSDVIASGDSRVHAILQRFHSEAFDVTSSQFHSSVAVSFTYQHQTP